MTWRQNVEVALWTLSLIAMGRAVPCAPLFGQDGGQGTGRPTINLFLLPDKKLFAQNEAFCNLL